VGGDCSSTQTNAASRHIHARKGNTECKFWLHPVVFDIQEVYAYDLSAADRRAIRQIIFEHFEYIISEYQRFHEGTE
jgi:hypothetical protein